MAITIEQLKEIKNRLAKRINDRRAGLSKAEQTGKKQILVCASTGCLSNDAVGVVAAFKRGIQLHHLEDSVEVHQTGCHGLCSQGPVVLIYPEGIFYRKVTKEATSIILQEHIIGGNVVKDFV